MVKQTAVRQISRFITENWDELDEVRAELLGFVARVQSYFVDELRKEVASSKLEQQRAILQKEETIRAKCQIISQMQEEHRR